MGSRQTNKKFIGRGEEREIFAQWLSDPAAPKVLYFHDALEEASKKGGVGKTKLLNKCRTMANGTAVLRSVVQTLSADRRPSYSRWTSF